MNKAIIQEYIKKISKNDIKKYSVSLGIILDDYELDIITNYIKNKNKLFFNDSNKFLNELKREVKEDTYIKILELYNKYKTKIS